MALPSPIKADEFINGDFPEDAQLINGEVVLVTDANWWHQELGARLLEALRGWVRANGRGRAIFGCNWEISSLDVYKPDAWWVADTSRLGASNRIAGGPDLAIEVRSPSTWRFDTGIKRARYESAGVQELWLVDTKSNTLIVYRRSSPDSPGFDIALEVEAGDELTSPLMPGFTLDIAELFADPL